MITLPVKVADVSVSKMNNSVQVSWHTFSEENISSFEVQRSANGNDFSKIGTVVATGNSSDKKTYTFNDAQPLYSINIYRLRIIDNAGKISYSKSVSLKVTSNGSLELFPNPVKNSLNIQLSNISSLIKIKIVDAVGKVMKTYQFTPGGSSTSVNIDVSSLPKGIYYVNTENGNKQFVKQ